MCGLNPMMQFVSCKHQCKCVFHSPSVLWPCLRMARPGCGPVWLTRGLTLRSLWTWAGPCATTSQLLRWAIRQCESPKRGLIKIKNRAFCFCASMKCFSCSFRAVVSSCRHTAGTCSGSVRIPPVNCTRGPCSRARGCCQGSVTGFPACSASAANQPTSQSVAFDL